MALSTGRLALLAAFSAISFAICMIVNALGSMGSIGVATNAGISNKYPTPITPAGWAFSIWGFIFFLQAVWVVVLVFSSFKRLFSSPSDASSRVSSTSSSSAVIDAGTLSVERVAQALGVFLPMAWNFETAWTFAFNYEVIWLSLPLMYCIAISLAIAFYRLQVFVLLTIASRGPALSLKELKQLAGWKRFCLLWAAVISTAVNLGWLCVAASVNTFVVATRYAGEPGATDKASYTYPHAESTWGIIAIVVLTVVITIATFRFVSVSLPLAVAWGFGGIASYTAAGATHESETGVHAAAISGMVALIVVAIVTLIAPQSFHFLHMLSCGWFKGTSSQYDRVQN